MSSQHFKNEPAVEVVLPEAIRLSTVPVPTIPSVGQAQPYPDETSSSSSASSSSTASATSNTFTTDILPQIDPIVAEVDMKKEARDSLPNDFEGCGSEDSAIADTECMNNFSPLAQSESISPDEDDAVILVDDKISASNLHVKSILRGIKDAGREKNSVRFHPLALLLDAALEGDLALVRKAAQQVCSCYHLYLMLNTCVFRCYCT